MQASRSSRSIMKNLRSSLNSGGGQSSMTTSDDQDLLSTGQKLDVLDDVLTKIEEKQKDQNGTDSYNANIASEASNLISNQQLNQTGHTSFKEGGGLSGKVAEHADSSTKAETGTSVQYIESTPSSPELSPEVSEYLQRVEDDKEKYPKKIILADKKKMEEIQQLDSDNEVIIIPITSDLEKKNKKKSTKYSVRWLLEWCHKVKDMIVGRVVYSKGINNSK